MSTKYKIGKEVPIEVLCARLEEISDVVTRGKTGFSMSVPAQVDVDADLVIAEASRRLKEFHDKFLSTVNSNE